MCQYLENGKRYVHSYWCNWIVQCFTSPPTQYRLYGRRDMWAIKTRHFYFFDNSDKYWPIFIIFFTAIYNNELRNKNLLKFSPHLKSVAALPCETWNVKCVDIQQGQLGRIQFKTDWKCLVTVLTFSSSLFYIRYSKMTLFCSYTGGESCTPLIYRFVYDVLSIAVPHTQQALT